MDFRTGDGLQFSSFHRDGSRVSASAIVIAAFCAHDAGIFIDVGKVMKMDHISPVLTRRVKT
jgi:hypothetical protein